MPYYGSVNVVDRSGWIKVYNLEKSLLMIGSASVNDIVLPLDRGSGVASIHLQIVHPQADLSRIRVVNLANSPVTIRRTAGVENTAISANGSVELVDGDSLTLGDFTLTFNIQSQNGFTASARSDHMGLKLELPGLQMKTGTRLAGRLTVSNYGEQKRCQFELELEGLPGDCYQIDPVPLLFPKGEETLQIRFFHRGNRPMAGICPIQLRATAPGAYPTEVVSLPVSLDVSPVYRYEVSIVGPASAEVKPAPIQPVLTAVKVVPPIIAPQPILENAVSEVPLYHQATPDNLALANEPRDSEPVTALPEDPQPVEPLVMAESTAPSMTQSYPVLENRQDPFANPGQMRRPRLPIKGQPIQVLKTLEEPPMPETGEPQAAPVKENKEP